MESISILDPSDFKLYKVRRVPEDEPLSSGVYYVAVNDPLRIAKRVDAVEHRRQNDPRPLYKQEVDIEAEVDNAMLVGD